MFFRYEAIFYIQYQDLKEQFGLIPREVGKLTFVIGSDINSFSEKEFNWLKEHLKCRFAEFSNWKEDELNIAISTIRKNDPALYSMKCDVFKQQ